jgi:hypothetical protein
VELRVDRVAGRDVRDRHARGLLGGDVERHGLPRHRHGHERARRAASLGTRHRARQDLAVDRKLDVRRHGRRFDADWRGAAGRPLEGGELRLGGGRRRERRRCSAGTGTSDRRRADIDAGRGDLDAAGQALLDVLAQALDGVGRAEVGAEDARDRVDDARDRFDEAENVWTTKLTAFSTTFLKPTQTRA